MKRNLKSYEATTRRGGDGDWERESGMLESHKKGEVAQNLNAIRENLHPKFTFMDFVKVAQEDQCVINMNNVLDDTVNAQRYVRIYLVYKFGDSLGKRILFNDLDFEIKGGRL